MDDLNLKEYTVKFYRPGITDDMCSVTIFSTSSKSAIEYVKSSYKSGTNFQLLQ